MDNLRRAKIISAVISFQSFHFLHVNSKKIRYSFRPSSLSLLYTMQFVNGHWNLFNADKSGTVRGLSDNFVGFTVPNGTWKTSGPCKLTLSLYCHSGRVLCLPYHSWQYLIFTLYDTHCVCVCIFVIQHK